MSAHPVSVHPDGRTFLVPDNANLREACLREGVRIYYGLGRLANCGGRGRCGTCVVRIQDGQSNLAVPTPKEHDRLASFGPGMRLACQTHIRGPLTFDPRG
jgi:ferredoxin